MSLEDWEWGPGCSGCDWEMGRVGRREESGFFCFSGYLSLLSSSICSSSSVSLLCSSFPGSDGVSSSEALKTLERGSPRSSSLSIRLGSSFRTGAGSVSTSSGGSKSGMGSPLSVCVTSLTGLF